MTRSHDKGISVASKREELVNKHNILHHPHLSLAPARIIKTRYSHKDGNYAMHHKTQNSLHLMRKGC
jgi:hypothetical protein